jgi:hypothetical protein
MQLDGTNVSVNVFDADSIDALVRHNPVADLSEGLYNVSVYVEDSAGYSNMTTWSFMVNLSVADFSLTVYSPVNGSFGSRRIPFNISTTRVVNKIEFINYNDRTPKWKVLCRNCDEYGFKRVRTKNLNEGENELTINASDDFGNSKEENISLFIDSKEPIISKILPKRNSVVNGSSFYIKYSEDNLEEISVNWNPNVVLSGCESGKNKNCSIDLNLDSFDGQFIDYWFNVSDSIRSIQSKETRVKVDTTSPVLSVNMPENNEFYVRKVPFNISVSEETTLEYYDQFDFSPKWRMLCNNCDEYGLDKNKLKSFKVGSHDIIIRAVDEAGNSDMETISFSVVDS